MHVEKPARVHFIPDLKVWAFVTLRAPIVVNGTATVSLLSDDTMHYAISIPTEDEKGFYITKRQSSNEFIKERMSNASEEKTIVVYAKIIIKYTGFPEKDIERAIEEISFDGESECGKYEVVDSVAVDVLPIRSDY